MTIAYDMGKHKESGILFLEQVFEQQNDYDYWEDENLVDCN